MLRFRLFIATFVATAFCVIGLSAQATAAIEIEYDPCPASTLDASQVFAPDLNIDNLLVGNYIDEVQVLQHADARIVCVSSGYGYAESNPDRRSLFYLSNGTIGIDTVSIGAVVGDSYYSTQLIVTTFAPNIAKPAVTKQLKRHAVATVKFVNRSDYTLVVRGGSFMKPAPDMVRWVKPGRSVFINTKRPRFDFDIVVELGSKKASNAVPMMRGTANTRTGRVSAVKLWQVGNPEQQSPARTAPMQGGWR